MSGNLAGEAQSNVNPPSNEGLCVGIHLGARTNRIETCMKRNLSVTRPG